MVWRDSSATKFDRVEIAFMCLVLFLIKPLTDEGEEKIQVPGENPDGKLQKMPHTNAKDSSSNQDSNLHSCNSIGGRCLLEKQMC